MSLDFSSRRRFADDERQKLGKLITMVFQYYGQQIARDTVTMHINELEADGEIEYVEIFRAYDAYRRDPKSLRPPSPAVIRAIIRPHADPDSIAKIFSANIEAAIRRFGYTREPEARIFLGDVTWQIVREHGGWLQLCTDHGVNIDPQTFKAQARDLLRARLTISPNLLTAARVQLAQRQSGIGIEQSKKAISLVPPLASTDETGNETSLARVGDLVASAVAGKSEALTGEGK